MAISQPTMALRGRKISVDGIVTHYLDAGDGPPLVLLHDGSYGAGGAATWFPNVDALAASYRVIAPDWLGFGGTDKLHDFKGGRGRRLWHMTRFLEVMNVEEAAFAGVSMGGTLLLQVVASGEQPWPARAVVAISGGGFVPDNEARRQTMEFDCTVESMRTVLSGIVHDPRWADDPELLDRRFNAAIEPGAWEAVAAARFKSPIAPPRSDFGNEDTTPYEQIAVPTLLIAGADDKLREPGYAHGVAARIPVAEVHVLQACGHFPQIEHADVVNRLMLAFLGKHYRDAG
jgi:pimeloyl-ACP methyl ester carboxylesterase